ncbi:MAG: hypothetical protein AAF645_12980 [Myxococcota bacterium]
MRVLSVLMCMCLLDACHDVSTIARFDGGTGADADEDGALPDGASDDRIDGPVRDRSVEDDAVEDTAVGDDGVADARPDEGPMDADPPDAPVDMRVDVGPPPANLGVDFNAPFLVRGAARLGGGILVVGIDNQGDRDTGRTRQALVAFVHETNETMDWAFNFGEAGNDQFLDVIVQGDVAIVVGVRRRGSESDVIILRFDEEGLLSSRRFPVGNGAFVTGIVPTPDGFVASGEALDDAALFRFDTAFEEMEILEFGFLGAFYGVTEHRGTVYAVGVSGSNGIVIEVPASRTPATVPRTVVPDAELVSVAGQGASVVVVGVTVAREVGGTRQALRMEFRPEVAIQLVDAAVNRFRQVSFAEGEERYAGILASADAAFVARLSGGRVSTQHVRGLTLTGVSGQVANLGEDPFLVGFEPVGEASVAPFRVQIVRSNTLGSFAEGPCGRGPQNWELTPDSTRGTSTSNVGVSSRTVEGVDFVLTEVVETTTRRDDCSM